jgi:hypothetical protein
MQGLLRFMDSHIWRYETAPEMGHPVLKGHPSFAGDQELRAAESSFAATMA